MSKLALHIGIDYEGSDSELFGCENDAHNMKKLTKDILGYKDENIMMMTDNTPNKPTHENIMKHLHLMADRTHTEKIKELFITYSGHGAPLHDTNGDESDKKDECLIPIDYKKSGYIKDDDIHTVLSKINENVKVIVLIDACHSGTMLDLRYVAGDKFFTENAKCSVKCDCVMISGCLDSQLSMDTYNFNNSGKYSGAMSSAFLLVLERFKYNIGFWPLLKNMLKVLSSKGFKQKPQITCSRQLSISSLFMAVGSAPFVSNE